LVLLSQNLTEKKKSILARFEKMANEANKIESRSFAREYVSNFLEKEPIPGIKKENEYVKEFIPEITLEEVNALAKEMDYR
jgi:zinc protease